MHSIGSCRILTVYTDVVQSTGEERHPVLFLVAVGCDHSVAKAAPQNVHHFMEGMEGVVHDGQQFGWHPLLHQLVQAANQEPTARAWA